ncbi:MAG: aldo/keto reductase [Spirochaetaceae bacterium]|nr:MAG: aldo/keto reductase [Spirochaetaceae bacterium]
MVSIRRNQLGRNGPEIPPIVFGTSAFGNLYAIIEPERKRSIVSECLAHVDAPVVFDSAGKYGAGMALESLGAILAELGVPPSDVIISNKLGWRRTPLTGPEPTFERGVWFGLEHDAVADISYDGILRCFDEGCELLGHSYVPQLVSVHDPDEYLAGAGDPSDRRRRVDDVLGAYNALFELKAKGLVRGVGIGSKDWKVIESLWSEVTFDWVMLACSFTVFTHPPELLAFIGELRSAGVGIINSAVFNAGFLTGGEYFDYRVPDPTAERPLYSWRETFHGLCAEHGVKPYDACIEFGLSAPGIAALSLNTSKPARVKDNVDAVSRLAPGEFWAAMKEAGLIAKEYPYLPKNM